MEAGTESESAIQVALIRHLVVEGGAQLSGGAGSETACIGVWTGRDSLNADPPEGVLDAFRDPPIRAASECQVVGEEDVILSYRAHTPTGEAAVGYTIDLESIKYEDDRALVLVTYDEASLSAGSWECLLAKADTGWVVQQCTGSAVSKRMSLASGPRREWACGSMCKSGKPDSNRRPSAWQADALPTELFPRHCCNVK